MSVLNAASERSPAAPRITTVRTVLLVTSDAESQHSLRNILINASWRVLSAANVGEAHVRLHENAPDLIICDRILADGSWFDVHVRRANDRPHPPIIVTAAEVDGSVWGEAINLGAANVLAQPFDPREVLWVLSNAHNLPALH